MPSLIPVSDEAVTLEALRLEPSIDGVEARLSLRSLEAEADPFDERFGCF